MISGCIAGEFPLLYNIKHWCSRSYRKLLSTLGIVVLRVDKTTAFLPPMLALLSVIGRSVWESGPPSCVNKGTGLTEHEAPLSLVLCHF